MLAAQKISRDKQRAKIGKTLDVIVDQVREDGVVVARTKSDAPEIDGNVFIKGATGLTPGDITKAKVVRTEAYDLWAEPTEKNKLSRLAPAPRGRVHRVISRL